MEGVAVMSFWNQRRVFLTGHTGFKGGWLSLWLQRLGANVVGYALTPATDPNIFTVADVAGGMQSISGDVRDLDRLTSALTASAPEVVFHLAAQPLVRYSYQHPVETYSTNVMGTVHLLEAVRQTPGVRAVVVVTSDKCYDNREWVWGYREHEPMGGHDPYSNSKGCAELVAAAYRSSFFSPAQYEQHGVALATARAGNVIGGGDWSADRLIPDIVRAFADSRPVSVRYPQAIRPWQHVLEPVSGYMRLAERLLTEGPTYGEGWNFGPNDSDAWTVEQILTHMMHAWGQGASWTRDPGEHPHEAHYLKLDCSKAQALLGWGPSLPISEALDWTVEWYQAFLRAQPMRTLCEDQLARYEQRLT